MTPLGVTAEEILTSAWPLELAHNPDGDGMFDGSCPCCQIIGHGFRVRVHCWRSGCDHGCQYSGIHVTGTLGAETLTKIAEHIRDHNGWTDRTDWNLTVEQI